METEAPNTASCKPRSFDTIGQWWLVGLGPRHRLSEACVLGLCGSHENGPPFSSDPVVEVVPPLLGKYISPYPELGNTTPKTV